MSHIHIPDGILPFWILAVGWLVSGFFIYLCLKKLAKHGTVQKLPYIGIVSALMIIAMMIEIVPIAYHFNFSVLAGIILGPSLAFIAVFIVDLIIAMFGHGGITVVGLNSLILGLEAVAGFYLFHIFISLFKSQNSRFYSSFCATICGLFLSTCLMVGIISLVKLPAMNNSTSETVEAESSQNKGHSKSEVTFADEINLHRFTKTIVFMSSVGWLLESLMSGLIIQYLYEINPGIIKRVVY